LRASHEATTRHALVGGNFASAPGHEAVPRVGPL